MTKIIVVIFITSLIFGTIGGMSLLKDNYYLKTKYFVMQLNYFKTEIAFANYSSGSKFGWLSGLWKKNVPSETVSGNTQSVPVLLYHGVMDQPGWKSDSVNISVNDFRKQMFALKKAGYQTVSLTQFLGFMQDGKQLPEKSVMITFDDSRADSFYSADPILRTLDFRAVMFVITGRTFETGNEKNTFHLSSDELKKMIESGRWETGSHTQNGHGFQKIDANGTQGHFLSDKLWLDSENRLETDGEFIARTNSDLVASKKDLERNLGTKVLAFAYPFGDYGRETQNFPGSRDILTQEVNDLFPLSFRQTDENEFPSNYPGKDFRLAKRINVNSDMSADQLLFLLNSHEEKALPYSDAFSINNGWLVGWGSFELRDGLLLTKASASEDSSLTFLNGTFNWTDYVMSATARLIQSNAFAAVARYADGNNYASCDFSGGGVALSQRVKGVENIIAESSQDFQIVPGKNVVIGVGVLGNKATCYIGGSAVVSGPLSPGLNHGGIGFKTWGNINNNSSLLVSDLQVSSAK